MTREMLLVLTIFSRELLGVSFGGTTVDVFQVGVAGVGIASYFNPMRMLSLLACLSAVGAAAVLMFALNGIPADKVFFRQVAACVFLFVGLGSYLLACSQKKLAIAYIDVCYYVAILGLAQVVLSLLGYDILIRVPKRLDSLTLEPSHYAVAVGPSCYYYLRYARGGVMRFQGWVVCLSMLLTVSATAVVVLFFAFVLAYFRRNRAAVVVMLIIASPFLLYVTPPRMIPETISSRFIKMSEYVGSDAQPWETRNLTVLSFGTNLDVGMAALRQGRVFGNGFCGHSEAYRNRYEGTEFENHRSYGLNSRSAHCLAIRVLSEFGVAGVLICLVVLYTLLTKKRDNLWCMFLLVTCAGRALKLGSWVDYGMPIFILAACYFAKNHSGRESRSQACSDSLHLPSEADLS